MGPEGKRLERGLLIARPLSVANSPVRERECYGHRPRELTFSDLAAGTWIVEFQPGDLRHLPATATVQVPGPPLQLRCEPAGSLTGVVAGEDIDKFAVSWLGLGNRCRLADLLRQGVAESNLPGSPQVVREDERFRIDGLGKEPGALYVRRPGDSRCALLENVRGGGGDIEVALHPGLSILGRVEGIEPWERRGVYLRASRDLIVQQARLQKDGTFEIAGLPPGRFHVEAFGIGILVDSRLAVQSDVQAGAEGVTLNVSR